MKIIKKIIVILMLISIIIIFAILILKSKLPKNENIQNDSVQTDDANLSEILNLSDTDNFSEIYEDGEFFIVSDYINGYLDAGALRQEEKVFALLNNEYKEQNDIQQNNLFQKIHIYDNFNEFEAKKMYTEQLTDGENTIKKYYINGQVWSENYSKCEELNIILIAREELETFSILPLDGEEKYIDILKEAKENAQKNNINENENTNEVEDEDEEIIEDEIIDEEYPSEYNEYSIYEMPRNEVVKKYFNNWKLQCLYKPEQAYEKLTNESKQKYKNFKQFSKYIKNINSDTKAAKYRIVSDDDTESKYDIVDSNGTKYIFYITDIMEYTVSIEE